jgi:hypothetical protein
VELNSGLGQANVYLRKHWQKLPLFLREEGAPLDANRLGAHDARLVGWRGLRGESG